MTYLDDVYSNRSGFKVKSEYFFKTPTSYLGVYPKGRKEASCLLSNSLYESGEATTTRLPQKLLIENNSLLRYKQSGQILYRVVYVLQF